jgi:hypothetical protein
MNHNGSQSFWDEHKGIPSRLSRRSFIQRVSLTSLGIYAALTGASQVAAYAGGHRHPGHSVAPAVCNGITCKLLECSGCACGGDYYHCTGCGQDYKKCYAGHSCSSFCAAPVC